MILLAFGLVAIMVLLSNVVFGTAAAVAVGGLAALLVAGLWFLIPLARRKEEESA